MKKTIYLDYQATTPVDPNVFAAMMPYYTEHFGNPHSAEHAYGWKAEAAVDVAREHIADVIAAASKEIIFTSGATEANNLALQGLSQAYPDKKHVITVVTEHKCVLESCAHLERLGYLVTYLPVAKTGLIDLEALEKAIRPDTLCVSVMAVNNEIGVIQPITEIGALCRKKNVLFHCDAAQAFGKIPLNVEKMQIDLLSISGHKIYGPKGIGALYIRSQPRVRIKPILFGGGQEQGLRPGTLPTPLVVGLGEAAKIAHKHMEKDRAHIAQLQQQLYQGLTAQLDDIAVNGDLTQRYPGNLNISFAHIEGESLVMALKALAISSGSACASARVEPSYVLRALGVDESLIHSAIRFGIGRFTTKEDIEHAIAIVVEAVNKLRKISPLG